MKHFYLVVIGLVLSTFSASAQTDIPKGWHLLDVKQDSFYGISLNKAYQFLQAKKIKTTTVTVAVLDSGVDTLQEDLQPVLWHNPKEIPNNNIDDDKNGYVDDYYGWNFLGNKNGESLVTTTKETVRFYHQYKDEFGGKQIDTLKLSAKEKYRYQVWKQAAEDLNISTDKELELSLTLMALKSIKNCDSILRNEMNVEEYTAAQLEKYEPKTNESKRSKLNYITTLQILQIDLDEKNTSIINQLEEYITTQKKEFEGKESKPTNYRKDIIKDDYNNIKDKFYGNKNVTASNSMHGTHVAGIIAAKRNNNMGIDGIADNVKLMPIRVVPDGDEYDKDIALAIFYAVDNGAKVINMSFGKEISPEKYWVDSAIKYAAAKDVLLVHAAGNDSEDNDTTNNFPSPIYQNKISQAKNFITVGASTDPKISGGGFVADFSNYGKHSVDVFAPGVKIYSTVLGVSNYSNQKGTSMAAPVVAGVATLLRSYFPKLTAIQTKNIIEKSVFRPNEDDEIQVSLFGMKVDRLKLKDACTTGGIVNAAKAVELAYKELGFRN
jgi:subtilisin family serine protease